MPLVLDLMRHGHSLPAEDGDDSRRRLSTQGRRELERIAARLAAMGWHPDRAFTSPLVRAQESARIALQAATPGLVLEEMAALHPDCDPDQVLAALGAAGATAGHVFLVGHQPLMGLLAAWLTGAEPPGFPTGTLQRIEFSGAIAPRSGVRGLRLTPG